MRVVMLRTAMIVANLTLLGCDPVNSPVLCNGYDGPIVITAIFHGGTGKLVTNLSKGECKTETLVSSPNIGTNSRRIEPQDMKDELVVTNAAGEVLANYSEDTNNRILPGRSFTPHFLLTDKGLFFIPREFEDSWRENIPVIERSANKPFPH